jgi:hypothetical protein
MQRHKQISNNDVNMQGMRHCNRHQLQKQQHDQRVKPQRALQLTMKLWRRGGSCSTADSASHACLSLLRTSRRNRDVAVKVAAAIVAVRHQLQSFFADEINSLGEASLRPRTRLPV